jgi:sec-independent protein translocase protein TatC
MVDPSPTHVEQPAAPGSPVADHVESTRMSFGDHLEELRRCIILSLVGIALAAGVSLYFGDEIMAIVLRPLLVVLRLHGQRPEVTALSPPETFTMYIKLGMLAGLILAMPWVLYQLWKFVSAGLYRHEQRFVRLFVPISAGLFALGIAFFYCIVLPIVLDFLVAFSPSVSLSDLQPTAIEHFLLKTPSIAPSSQPEGTGIAVPLYHSDPVEPAPGTAWINRTSKELRIMTEDGLLFAPLMSASKAAVSGQFALHLYVSFVLSLALAFGLAFETPVLVVFLSLVGLVPAASMAGARRFIIFGIVVVAAVLTPPDVLSMILLSLPMIGLFEAGLLAARLLEGRKRT